MEIGYVARAHGVRGQLRVQGAGSDALERLERVLLDGEAAPRRIEAVEAIDRAYLIKLEGIADRTAAEALRGRTLLAPRADLPPPSEDEIYVADLVGCAVEDSAGTPLGTVREVTDNGAHDLLVITRPDGREAMVPLVEPIVLSVDVEARRIVCDPPEGLLDL